MIYRAIIEEVVDKCTAKVRIPLIHRSSMSNQYTHEANLPEAKICTLANTEPNIRVGDVVVVAFENNDSTKPIIIGYLYTGNEYGTYTSPKVNSLKVNLDTKLSEDTTIGTITYNEILQLKNIKENIQESINQILNRLDNIESKIEIKS